jgi:superfamily II RNA helicase
MNSQTPHIRAHNQVYPMSSYLTIVNPSTPCEGFPIEDQLACPFPFPLDPFQKHAVKAIHNGHNVLVTAKTGSGKTLVGEYLIHHCLKKGQRVFYTTPIKSLSNQKFHDLKQMFPSVGIMTGDIKYRPDAQIVIMTTEILRNLLYKQGTQTARVGITAQMSLENLGGVVFDEVHYINDRERGKVWEETMILLDPKVQQVLLSATIDKPELFASWLGDLKQVPIYLISTSYRIVPLEHAVFLGKQPQLLMDNKEVFYADSYKCYLDWRQQKRKDKEVKEKQVRDRKASGWENAVVKGGGMPAFNHQLNECITYLKENSLLPSLFFVFSRKGCENLANLVAGSLIDSSDAAAIRHIWDFHLHKYREILEHLPQAHQLKELVMRGIAFHHSGLLPMLREMVELLFGRGLVKCLFATETFAVGINMPTKTVVFLDLEKYSDECQGLRLLRTDEYIQMAGRAGRRGKDEKGYVFYLPQRDPVGLGELQLMMTGRKSPISSQMDFGYDFVLKTFQSKNLQWMDLLEKSYWYRQVQGEKAESLKRFQQLQADLEKFPLTPLQLEECKAREEAETKAKIFVNKQKKEAQRTLERLKETQSGPQWDMCWNRYKTYIGTEQKIKEEQSSIKQLESIHLSKVEPVLALLQKWGFLTEEKTLTELGVLASEINEGQPILMAKAYQDGIWKGMTQTDFVVFLAAFLNEGKREDEPHPDDLSISKATRDALNYVDSVAYQCQKDEESYQLSFAKKHQWDLLTGWVDPLQKWMEEEEAAVICSELGIYEGNFIRSVLKVANMVEEWVTLATFTKNIELLQLLEGLKEKLVRGIVRPESLYLNLD